MNTIRMTGASAGVQLQRDGKALDWLSLFGLSGAAEETMPECRGIYFLDSDAGRFEGAKWALTELHSGENACRMRLRAGSFEVTAALEMDAATGVLSWSTELRNADQQPHTVYACLPRIPLRGNDYAYYGQYSGWCAENQGGWCDVPAGNLVLTNSAGRSTESCTPFACIRHKTTGRAAAIHVLPIGDWVIRFRRIAAHRLSYTVVEAGLSDASLRLTLRPGETLMLPKLVLCGFCGAVENCCEGLQRWLLRQYPHETLPELAYNTWFFDFDILDADRLKRQVQAAKAAGCRTFVVDAGWFGKGFDWENQVGNWDECTEHAFEGRMNEFADYVRAQGMNFGLWMEPERACPGTRVYQEHPDWFLKADAIIFDLTQPQVVDYLTEQVTRLVRTYDLRWMKLDYNTNMLRDLTGENFYRYYLGEQRFLTEIRRRNPTCSFEGCSSGGMRTDFCNVLSNYHGHFVSDTVNPLEVLRMRQNTMPRLLPAYLGSWIVLQETPFAVGTYFDHNRSERTKVLSAGDGWWDQTVDVSIDFALTVNLLGEWGISGDLGSLSAENLARVRRAAEFYERHRALLARTVCHPLTKLQPIDNYKGWAAMQYENIDGLGSLLYVFRLVDDSDTLFVYPKNLLPAQRYLVRCGETEDCRTGAELLHFGVAVYCPSRFEARLIELIPAQADNYENEKENEL